MQVDAYLTNLSPFAQQRSCAGGIPIPREQKERVERVQFLQVEKIDTRICLNR